MSQEELEMFVNSIIEPNIQPTRGASQGCDSDACLIDFLVTNDDTE